jgi:hypothetical protein
MLIKGLLGAIFAALLIGLTRQEFVRHYDKSVYQVRLELAMQLYLKGESPKDAFAKADQFIEYLRTLKR